jgi:hypothetical protein
VDNRGWPIDALRRTRAALFDAVNAAGAPERVRHERL